MGMLTLEKNCLLGGEFFFKKGEKYILFSEGNGAEYRPRKGPKKNPDAVAWGCRNIWN